MSLSQYHDCCQDLEFQKAAIKESHHKLWTNERKTRKTGTSFLYVSHFNKVFFSSGVPGFMLFYHMFLSKIFNQDILLRKRIRLKKVCQ